jgi:hypothetical protein
MRKSFLFGFAIAALALAGGCERKSQTAELEALDNRLGAGPGNGTSRTRTLEDQIVIDPARIAPQSRNEAVAGAPSRSAPPSADLPVQHPANQVHRSINKFAGCSLDVDSSTKWSGRFPPTLPLPPGARVREAAGSDRGTCALRAVSFTVAASPKAMAGYYTELARLGDFEMTSSSEGQKGTMLSAWRDSDGAAFYAIIQPKTQGVQIEVVSNRGS